MNKLLKKTIFMGIILGFVSCQKQSEMPVPTSMQVDSESHLNSPDFIADLKKMMIDKGFKYNSEVCVKDQSGDFHINYQLGSDNKELFESALNEYQNSTLIFEAKEESDPIYNSSVLIDNSPVLTRTAPVKIQDSFNNNSSVQLMANDREKMRNEMHIAILGSSIPKGKVAKLQTNNQKNNGYGFNLYGFSLWSGQSMYLYFSPGSVDIYNRSNYWYELINIDWYKNGVFLDRTAINNIAHFGYFENPNSAMLRVSNWNSSTYPIRISYNFLPAYLDI
jgi:hypothetical protein